MRAKAIGFTQKDGRGGFTDSEYARLTQFSDHLSEVGRRKKLLQAARAGNAEAIRELRDAYKCRVEAL